MVRPLNLRAHQAAQPNIHTKFTPSNRSNQSDQINSRQIFSTRPNTASQVK